MFGRDGWKNRAKMRKIPNFLGLRRGISPICPLHIRTPLYTFLMTNFPLLSQKLATKLKTVLSDQFHSVLFIFTLSHPKVMG